MVMSVKRNVDDAGLTIRYCLMNSTVRDALPFGNVSSTRSKQSREIISKFKPLGDKDDRGKRRSFGIASELSVMRSV